METPMPISPSSLASFQSAALSPATMAVASYVMSNFFPFLPESLTRIFQDLRNHPRFAKLFSVLFALWAFGPYAWTQVTQMWDKVQSAATTKISIDNEDDLYPHLKDWLSKRRAFYWNRDFKVTSSMDYLRLIKSITQTKEEQIRGRWLGSMGLQYDPLRILPIFFYKGRLFIVEGSFIYDGTITLKTLGTSVKPLNAILEEVVDMYKKSKSETTVIQRPCHNGGYNWEKVSTKAQRTLYSVNLRPGQKEELLADLDNYVEAKTAAWYKARCVPYRRGYLFHGKPGCGKSTFATALAAHYQCDIYMLSLLDQYMNDHRLLELLKVLPPRALVLLEDIDSAGLKREIMEDDDWDLYNGSRRRSGVTLSGLLNAIDGADAPEGHILIMTSNNPENLDDALVRAGRISVKVEFRRSSPGQGKEIFLRMYKGDPESGEPDYDVDMLAAKFANVLPDDEFSPAQLQDYMLERKSQPRRAVEELEGWVKRIRDERAAELKAKEEKAKKERKRKRAMKKLMERREEEDDREDEEEDGEGTDDDGDSQKTQVAETPEVFEAQPQEPQWSILKSNCLVM